MCGSRTGGWSLPSVMSDWQHCVDWLLAKYCSCRLRLDWCWCRWKTSVKGRLLVSPPGVEKTSRLGSRDPIASRVKCGPYGGKNSGTKSWTVSWLSLETKVEPGLRGSRVMSGDRRRLHRVREVCSGSPENHWVTRLSHRTKAEDSTRTCGHPGRFNRRGRAVKPLGPF
jgi:hypothetical protein